MPNHFIIEKLFFVLLLVLLIANAYVDADGLNRYFIKRTLIAVVLSILVMSIPAILLGRL